ncbi:MAG: Fe-S cluster assembly protein SufD, partial [Calditrichaeota bacterium]
EPFAALNTAFSGDGLFLHVRENVAVREPLHVLYLSLPGEQEFTVHPRNLIVLEPNAQFKVFESYVAQQESVYFTNVLNEIVVGADSRLEWIKLQDESTSAYHISWTQVVQARNSYLSSVNLDFGSRLARNNLNVRLADEHCETHLWGVYLGDGAQLVDNHTFIDHAMPNCFSNELYKGILAGRARGVFNGKILVRRGAQKTNALQSNKTLLLTNDCEIDAKPQLEIFADDVKCTHGATIGQLDEDAYFYLRARGLGAETARALLRYAFLADVLENVTLEQLRERLDGLLFERLKTMKEA